MWLVLLSSVESERSEYSVFSVSFVLLSHTLGQKNQSAFKNPPRIPILWISFLAHFSSSSSSSRRRRRRQRRQRRKSKVKQKTSSRGRSRRETTRPEARDKHRARERERKKKISRCLIFLTVFFWSLRRRSKSNSTTGGGVVVAQKTWRWRLFLCVVVLSLSRF